MLSNDRNTKQGFTFIEILIALSLFGIATGGFLELNRWINDSVNTEAAKVDRDIENTEMLKLVTQPKYLGALSEFAENDALAKCMKIDQVMCDSTMDYPLTPFNLTTKTKIDIVSTSANLNSIRDELSFRVHCPENKQSCDRAAYFTVLVKTYLTYLNFKTAVIEKKGVVTPDFTNVVTYIPDTSIASGRPINVILFIDNSNSMVFAKDQIKAALDALLNKLSTMNVTVGLYNLGPTGGYAKTSTFYLDGSGNRMPMPPLPYPGNFTYYQEEVLGGSWRLYPNYNFNPTSYITTYAQGTNAIFPFLTTDDVTTRSNKLSSIKNLVDSYFNSSSPNYDTPFCSILRYLETPMSPNPFLLDPFTPTAFIIISNEDDETDFTRAWYKVSHCYKSRIESWLTSPNYYNYSGQYQTKFAYATANVLIDGAPATMIAPVQIADAYNSSYASGSDCSAEIPSMYSSTFESKMSSYLNSLTNTKYIIGSGYTITKCSIVNLYNYFAMKLTSPDPTICANVDSGVTTTSINYVPGTCKEYYGGLGTLGTGEVDYPIIPGATDPTEAAYQSIKNHLNLSNVLYMPIVHTDGTTCTLTPGSQVGTKYMALGAKAGMNFVPVPICSPDYSSHLNKLDSWISNFSANDIQLSPTVASNFSAVEILRNGAIISLTSNVDYSLVGTTLAFKPGIIQPNDIIRVYLK